MTATARTVRTASMRIPAWLFMVMLILAGLAVLMLRDTGVLVSDVTPTLPPLVPGAPV